MLTAQGYTVNLWQGDLAQISWPPVYFEFSCEGIGLTGSEFSYYII